MNTGFGCVEAGFCRAKNTVNILAKNFIVFGIASLGFWALGFGLMFADGNSYLGLAGWFLSGADNSPNTAEAYLGIYSSQFFFQLAFAATAATIVSGCVAERIHYSSFIIFALVLAAVIYPIAGHWIWGGGWLAALGMWDFAGSTVVHSVGGWAGLTGILFLGPRIGKYRKDGGVSPILGHSMPLAFLGGMILWLGWFGFNPGSTMGVIADGGLSVSHIVVTTNLSCAAALISATIWSYVRTKKPDFSMTVNGALAGLVAITAPCAFVTPVASVIIGAIAGILVVSAVVFFDRLRIDDPVGALSVHLVCGIWGTLSVGLWASTEMPGGIDANGLFNGGGPNLLLAQAIGVIAVGLFTVISTVIVWAALRYSLGLRVSPVVEVEGLDIHEMGMEAYPHERSIDVLSLLKRSRMGLHTKSLTKEAKEISANRISVPTDSAVHHFRIKEADVDEFMGYWSKLSMVDRADENPAFTKLSPFFTTMKDGMLRFRGGDRDEIVQSLDLVVEGFNPSAKVVYVDNSDSSKLIAVATD
ncbi:UNVERIFIED_CONTAM: hypothetical protein GTU68_013062 [Idotea baltica]|nr:hypothetical protein [Idotea baltica]